MSGPILTRGPGVKTNPGPRAQRGRRVRVLTGMSLMRLRVTRRDRERDSHSARANPCDNNEQLLWCQDPHRSRGQFVADLRGLKMGPALIKPLVPRFRIVMLGLDNSGKTTILYRIKQNFFSQHRPTVGFNCETVGYYRTNSRDVRSHFDKSDKTGIIAFPNFKFYDFQIASRRKLFQIWDVGGQEKTR